MTAVRVTAIVPAPANARCRTENAGPDTRRHVTTANTDAAQIALTASTTGRGVSVPLPKPWNTAIGQLK
jgi:hypothetical protein